MVIQLHDFLGCVCILSILQNLIIYKQLLPATRMDYLFILVNLFQVVTAIINHIKNIFNVLMQGTQPSLHPQLTLPTENTDLPRILPDLKQLTIVLCLLLLRDHLFPFGLTAEVTALHNSELELPDQKPEGAVLWQMTPRVFCFKTCFSPPYSSL